jgi:hypothetical protein
MALCLHPNTNECAPGFKGYSLYDSPGNRRLPSPDSVRFAFSNRDIVAQAEPHSRFSTILEVFAEGELDEETKQEILEDLEACMRPAA